MIAMLEDAITCFRRYCVDRTSQGRRLFREAESWLLMETDEARVPFSAVCDLLDLDADWIRGRLRRWEEEARGQVARRP
jgi:hypothetical protein